MKKLLVLMLVMATQVQAKLAKNEDMQLARSVFFESESINIDEHIDSMTQMIITRQPHWEKYRDLIRGKVRGILSSEAYQNEVAQIISKNFTQSDLAQLSKIMKQPVMVKWNRTAPLFWPEIAMVTTDHVLPITNELVREISEKERSISDGLASNDKGRKLTNLLRNNKCAELYDFTDQIFQREPKDIEALYARGYCRLKEKSYKQAEKLYLEVYQQNKEYRRINYNLARLYLDTRKSQQALKFAVKETKLNPTDPDSFVLLGFTYLTNNDNKKACKAFKDAELIEPKISSFEPKIRACNSL